MSILRRLLNVNARPDVAAIVAAAKNPEITTIEARLAELQEAELAAGREWAKWADEANPAIRSPLKFKTDDSIAQAKSRLDEINARREEMTRQSFALRARLADLNPASLDAVRDALAPVRSGAVQDMTDAAAALYRAFALYNTVSEAMRINGSDGAAAPLMPVNIPTVDYFVAKAAQS